MSGVSSHPRFGDLPRTLPVFPLAGVLLLPRGRLPLNVFEPRYLNLVADALGEGRMFGMIQPVDPDAEGDGDEDEPPALYRMGCTGRITSFAETDDGRLLITLTGLCRFRVLQEVEPLRGYRRLVVDYDPFRADLDEGEPAVVDRARLLAALKPYFKLEGLQLDWAAVDAAPDEALITALAMLCPFDPREKQALLEASTVTARCEMMTALLEMAVLQSGGSTRQ
ncbi:MAG: LON peptidase substrate-binding domain-containing protein [Alphaproteobacteria bacterium]|nr:LON peptidase substrate-binding domain-containing protein [Alphaproteobacteria bacterium]